MSWTVITREKAGAQVNMDFDAMLLRRLGCAPEPVLHLYDWEAPSITHGYFVDPRDLLEVDTLAALGVQLARRPTGGGVIIHTIDFAFSLLVPAGHTAFSTNTLHNYAFINTIVADVVRKVLPRNLAGDIGLLSCPQEACKESLPFCMADPTVFDVMIGGQKVAGGAQRRTRHGFLHQGSISLGVPDQLFLQGILKEDAVAHLMRQRSYPLAGVGASAQHLEEFRSELRDILKQAIEQAV